MSIAQGSAIPPSLPARSARAARPPASGFGTDHASVFSPSPRCQGNPWTTDIEQARARCVVYVVVGLFSPIQDVFILHLSLTFIVVRTRKTRSVAAQCLFLSFEGQVIFERYESG